jgi:hypothetical protein
MTSPCGCAEPVDAHLLPLDLAGFDLAADKHLDKIVFRSSDIDEIRPVLIGDQPATVSIYLRFAGEHRLDTRDGGLCSEYVHVETVFLENSRVHSDPDHGE